MWRVVCEGSEKKQTALLLNYDEENKASIGVASPDPIGAFVSAVILPKSRLHSPALTGTRFRRQRKDTGL